MLSKDRRIQRETRTVEAMIRISCRAFHETKGDPCSDCSELLAYVLSRLDRCPYRKKKPACTNCPIHCYSPEMRERIRAVMRYAGPRMICRHPVLAFCHFADQRRNFPAPEGTSGKDLTEKGRGA
jgi:Nitrous oxide-stimulated promoter